jgi:hypothetical protein
VVTAIWHAWAADLQPAAAAVRKRRWSGYGGRATGNNDCDRSLIRLDRCRNDVHSSRLQFTCRPTITVITAAASPSSSYNGPAQFTARMMDGLANYAAIAGREQLTGRARDTCQNT